MSDSIIIIEKPDWISWEDIRQCVFDAHSDNRKRGITMRAPLATSEDMASKVGDKGKVYVALDGNNVVATASIAIKKSSLWCGKGDYGLFCLAGVLNDYTGKGIYRQLCFERERYAKSISVSRIFFDTNERNRRVLYYAKKNGFKSVDLRFCGDHYNIVMVKWLQSSPYPSCYIRLQFMFRFVIKKTYYTIVSFTKRIIKIFAL